jgi:hypothetical protein
MKRSFYFLFLIAFYCTTANPAFADGGYNFSFVAEQKKLSAEQDNKGAVMQSKEQWAYKVSIQNRSFRDLANVEIKYLVFMKPEIPGQKFKPGQSELVRKEGSTTIPALKNNDTYILTTDSVELKNTTLKGGYYWKGGSNPRTRDSLKGVWLRVYINGQQVSEFTDPASIRDKETWGQQ